MKSKRHRLHLAASKTHKWLALIIGAQLLIWFASGALMLEAEKTPLAPVAMDVLGARAARLSLTEGRYHQVRRMFAAVGNHVTALHRNRIGELALPEDLEPGQYRLLGEADLALILPPGKTGQI